MCFFRFYFWVKPHKNPASCASSSAGDSPQQRMLSQSSILPSVDLALSSSLQTDENIHRFQSPQGQIAISRTSWLLHVAAIEPQRQQSNYFYELCHQLGWLLLPSCENTHSPPPSSSGRTGEQRRKGLTFWGKPILSVADSSACSSTFRVFVCTCVSWQNDES